MTPLDEAIEDELYTVANRLGIKQADARDAIERVEDRRELLRRWKREYTRRSRGVLIADGKRWAQANAADAAERHTELQSDHAASRRSTREQMRLGRRVDAIIAETLLEPGPGVSQLGTTKIKGGESDGTPPDAVESRTAYGMTFRAHWLMIERYIEAVENEWDEFVGRGQSKNWWIASAEEKDHEILNRYMGVNSTEVAKINPALGDKRRIEIVRLSRKLRPLTGEPK